MEQIPVEETIQPEPVLTLEQKAQAIQDFITPPPKDRKEADGGKNE